MNLTLTQYLEDCKRHLWDYQTEPIDPKMTISLYGYSFDQILEHAKYFDECRINGFSTYKALLMFGEYLKST